MRIIPRLDIKGPNVVKGIHLEGLRVMGSPAEFASYYYENGADELGNWRLRHNVNKTGHND